MNLPKPDESVYIQQHLANERTMLAWIRTAIAFIGIGFLVTNLHFSSTMQESFSDELITIIGLFSVLVGVLTIVLAMFSYFRNLKSINSQTYHSSRYTVLILGIFVFLIGSLFAVYFIQTL